MTSRRIAGDLIAICTVWLVWAVLSPIIAERARIDPPLQHICPMLSIKHGVGSDLKTWTKAKDVCSQ